MLRKLYFSLITLSISFAASAQTTTTTVVAVTTTDTAKPATPAPAPAVIITGSADFYYRYDFHKVNNNLTSFTSSHDQFRLGMATVKLEHKTAKMDMVADLGFGPRAREFDYADNGSTADAGRGIDQAIKQLYISYSPAAWVKFTGGVWATHIGYEVVDAFANRNYSMSYMFTNGPFSHTGVRADFTIGKSGIMIGVANPTDHRLLAASDSNHKNIIAQYSYAPSDNFKLYLNYVGGKDVADNKVHQYDLVINSKITPMFGIGVNGTVNEYSGYDPATSTYGDGHSWWGAALYFNLDPKPWFGLTLRSEYFSDKYGAKLFPVDGSVGAKVFANTLSANFKVDGFTFIPEFRLDHSDNPLFHAKDGTSSKGDASFLIACVYSF